MIALGKDNVDDHMITTDIKNPDAYQGIEGIAERGRDGRHHAGDVLSNGELTCKQAIAAVLHTPSDDFAHAIYLQVRRKWRTLYESHPTSSSKQMRTLPRNIAIPAANRFVLWAMRNIAQAQQDQLLFMSRHGIEPSSSMIAEADQTAEADVSDAESVE